MFSACFYSDIFHVLCVTYQEENSYTKLRSLIKTLLSVGGDSVEVMYTTEEWEVITLIIEESEYVRYHGIGNGE